MIYLIALLYICLFKQEQGNVNSLKKIILVVSTVFKIYIYILKILRVVNNLKKIDFLIK